MSQEEMMAEDFDWTQHPVLRPRRQLSHQGPPKPRHVRRKKFASEEKDWDGYGSDSDEGLKKTYI